MVALLVYNLNDCVFSGADYRSFLNLDAIFLEPQVSTGQIRVFIYLNTKVCGPLVPVNPTKPLPGPTLDGSM